MSLKILLFINFFLKKWDTEVYECFTVRGLLYSARDTEVKKKLSLLNHFVCRATCYTAGDMKVLFSLSQCRLCRRIHRKAT